MQNLTVYYTSEPLSNEQFLSLRQKLPVWQRERGEKSQEENEWDAYHRRTRRRLLQISCCSGAVPRTNSLLSLMCIPLCAFYTNHSSFIFPGKHLYLPLPLTLNFPIIFIIITSTVLLFTYVCVVMYNFVISYNGKKKIKIYKK